MVTKMGQETTYRVVGKHKGSDVDERVNAYSEKQAKLKAGFQFGLGGREQISEFMKNKSIRVVKA